MRKLLITTMIFFLGLSAPEIVTKAEAQTRTERQKVRAKERRVKRRVTRRTTRRVVRRRVTRRAHFAYRSLPRYRTTVVATPNGAVIVKRGGVPYRYYNGIYYKPVNSGFVVVRPVRGVRVATLPAARRRVIISNQTYYYYYGTFYKEVDSEYEVVEAPEGALVDALPDGYEVEEIDGTEYYNLDGDYYQEVETDELEDGVGYEVVKLA